MGPPSQLYRRADSLGDPELDRFVARGGEPSGIAGANPARVGDGDMPISSNGFGPGVALLFLSHAKESGLGESDASCQIEAERVSVPCVGVGHSVCRMMGAAGGAPKGNKNAVRHGSYTAPRIS